MEQRISLVTLGVADVSRAKAFYEALGWRGRELERTVFFQAGGLAVVLWGWEELVADSGVSDATGPRFGGMALAHNVRSRAEVDQIIAAAQEAGATVTRPAEQTFYGGYGGYFADLDGHMWEIAHNPTFTLSEDGSLVLPDFDAA